MALVIETGSGISGANSYVTLIEARTYHQDRGTVLFADDIVLSGLLVRATDYIESLRDRFKGTKVFPDPSYLQWPRYSVYIDDNEDPLSELIVPILIKNAQCQLAFELQTVDPLRTSDQAYPVKREKVDVIETEYAVVNNSGPALPSIPKVDALLAPLLRWSGLTSVRI